MKFVISISMALVLLAGCTSSRQHVGGEYETLGQDPSRNNDAARRENAKALELLAHGKYAEAEVAAKDALSADITYGPGHNSLGMAYYHQGKFYVAAWEFEFACKLMPHLAEPFNNLGLVLESVGRVPDAQKQYGEALKLQPENPEMIGNLARAKIRQGDRGLEVQDLLHKLIVRDTRPEWLAWAKETLALMPASELGPATREHKP